jgi:hypothetical protein
MLPTQSTNQPKVIENKNNVKPACGKKGKEPVNGLCCPGLRLSTGGSVCTEIPKNKK